MQNASWRTWVPAAVLAVAFGIASAGPVRACPNCKEAVAAQDSNSAREGKPTTFMQHGYNWSVLFMMVMPFTLLGTGAFFVARAVKRGALPEM